MTKIAIIIGTTRQQRFGEQPARWLHEIAQQAGTDAEFTLVDLRDINLPLFDEPTPPAAGQPLTSEVGQAWSKIVGEHDGYIFVTGEYDHTIPASLANALQYLYAEWTNKPVAYVGYGAEMGGGRAIEHLRQVAGQLGQFDIDTHLTIPNYWGQLNEQGAWQPSEQQAERAKALVSKLAFWAGVFEDARKKLPN